MGVFSICVNIAENFKCWFTYTIAIHNLFFVVPTHTPNKPLTKINSTWPPVDNPSVKTNREFSEDLPFCLFTRFLKILIFNEGWRKNFRPDPCWILDFEEVQGDFEEIVQIFWY